MGRNRKKTKPDWWLTAKDFRLANEWVRQELLAIIRWCGADGVTAGDVVSLLSTGTSNPNRPTAPDGYMTLERHRRGRLVWRNIEHLCEGRAIEKFDDWGDGYLSLREVNALDRLAYALSQETS